MARLSLTALDEWYYSPVTRFSPQPSARVLNAGESLELTASGSIYTPNAGAPVLNSDGNLPTATDLSDAPWYILHVRVANAVAPPVSLEDAITIAFDGSPIPMPVYNELDSTLGASGSPAVQGSVYYRVPATVSSITFTSSTLIANPGSLVYSFSIPTIPASSTGERTALTPIEEWNQCPWNIVGGGTINLVDGVPTALTLPTAATIAALNTPSYYMLAAVAQFATPAAGTESLQVTYNGSAVTQDSFPVSAATGVALITPFPCTAVANDPDNGLLRSYYNHLSTRGTTGVSLTSYGSDAQVVYRWHIPNFPEAQ